jgi:hypothetical protein
VIPSAVIWCDVDPAYVFHVANSFDAPDGTVVMDVVAYPSMFNENLRGPDAKGALERWTIDPVAKSVVRVVIDPEPQEFPRPDERRFGQSYRYIYTSASPTAEEGAPAGSKLFKHDMEGGARQVHDFGAGRHPGEFVFVPASADSAEDEGWLIGFVVDSERDTRTSSSSMRRRSRERLSQQSSFPTACRQDSMATGCRIDWRLSEVANEEFGLRFFSIGDRHGRSLAYVLGLDRWIAATSEQDAPAHALKADRVTGQKH